MTSSWPRNSRRSASQIPVAALVALISTFAIYAAMVATERGRVSEALARFAGLRRNVVVDAVGPAILAAAVPVLVVVAIGLLIAIARHGGRRATYVFALASIVLTNVLVQVAKLGLEYADPLGGEAFRRSQGAFPSGHSAIATSVALALIMVAPSQRRRMATLSAAGFALAVNMSLLWVGWHYTSDIVAATLVAFAVAAICRRRAEGRRPGAREVAVIILTLTVAGLSLALGGLLYDVEFLGKSLALLFGSVAIAGTTVGVVTAFVMTTPTALAISTTGDQSVGGRAHRRRDPSATRV